MSKITQRKKLSKSTWVMLIALGVAIIVAVVLHFVGIINLGFIGDWAIALAMFGTVSGWNAAIILALPFIAGIVFLYVLKAYFIGEVVQTVAGTPGGYSPTPTYPAATPAKSDTETTIS